jgi:hypothetical protein
LLPLYKPPPSLGEEWRAIFDSLVDPLRNIHFYLRNPSVWRLSDQQFQRSCAALAAADASAERALGQLDGIAPRTWAAGYAIRMAVGPVIEELRDATSISPNRAQELFAYYRKRLDEILKPLDARPLLLALRQAATDERGVRLGLSSTEPPPARSLPVKGTSQQPAGEGKTPLKEPPPEAFAAYRLARFMGMNQTEIAKRLAEEFGRPIDQGTVSRWIKWVVTWIEAGNVLPDLPNPDRKQPKPMDPERLDLGPRADGLTKRQRERRSDDD